MYLIIKYVIIFLFYLDPPGHAMLKQLEAECTKYRLPDSELQSKAFKLHPSPSLTLIAQSLHQPTPGTPIISSLHRNHPVASMTAQQNLYPPGNKINTTSMHGIYTKTDTPMLPPLPIPEIKGPCDIRSTPPPPPPLMEFEDISPTRNDFDKKRLKNGKHLLPLELLKQQLRANNSSPVNKTKNMDIKISYSPVSNSGCSNSPISPAVKDITPTENTFPNKFSNYESISDGEHASCLEVEDISPVITPKIENKLIKQASVEDDDAMSLSSISSNEDSKVELNVKNIRLKKDVPQTASPHITTNTNLSNSNLNIRNPLFPYRPNLPPAPPQGYFTPPQSIPTGPPQHSVGLMDFAMSMHQKFNQVQYQQPLFQQPRPNLGTSNLSLSSSNSMNFNSNNSTRQTFQTLNHTEIIKNALYGCTNLPVPINPNQINAYSQPPPPPQLPQPPPTPQTYHPPGLNSQLAAPPPVPPVVQKEIPFSFHVKAGCARDLSQELKRILAKDTLKKLVEQSAFSAFENWWGKQKTPKSLSENENVKQIKMEDNTSKNLLTDKSSNILPQTVSQPKLESLSVTSVLLHNLFGDDKNNENRPPSSASFLNSFRISRKPQAQSTMKVSHISRKRRPWPSLNKTKNKLQRLEDSEEEDEEEEDEDDDRRDEGEEEDQFEQFALRQSE